MLHRIGEFYSHPEPPGQHHVASLFTLGAGALVLASLTIPYFTPPIADDYFIHFLCMATAGLGGIAVLRRERGILGFAALLVAAAAVGLFAFSYVFASAYALLMGLAD